MCIRDRRYVELCVAHADLYKRQKAIDAKDRATAIDIKVQLREKEAERKRVETMSVTDALTGLEMCRRDRIKAEPDAHASHA